MKRISLLALCLCSTALNAQSPDVALLGDVEPSDATASDAGQVVDAAAQQDAGPADVNAPDVDTADVSDEQCENRCEANTLLFCDAGEQARFDCSEIDAQCGELSPEWGFDCLLPQGAQCAAGYAQGLSACEGAFNTTSCCVEGVCGAPEDATSCTLYADDNTTPPTELLGTPLELDDETQNCVGCSQSGALSFTLFPLALLFWRTRKKK